MIDGEETYMKRDSGDTRTERERESEIRVLRGSRIDVVLVGCFSDWMGLLHCSKVPIGLLSCVKICFYCTEIY